MIFLFPIISSFYRILSMFFTVLTQTKHFPLLQIFICEICTFHCFYVEFIYVFRLIVTAMEAIIRATSSTSTQTLFARCKFGAFVMSNLLLSLTYNVPVIISLMVKFLYETCLKFRLNRRKKKEHWAFQINKYGLIYD